MEVRRERYKRWRKSGLLLIVVMFILLLINEERESKNQIHV